MANNIMDGFDTKIYWKPRSSLTKKEHQQLEIAHIVFTSIDNAKYYISSASKEVLAEALKICQRRDAKTLTRLIEAQIRKREREEKKKVVEGM
jgi:hypothetical protein